MSSVFCCVKNCGTTADKNADVTFHGLPHDPVKFKKYTVAIPEEILKRLGKFCVICSKHFTEDSYEPAGRPKVEQKLKPGVIPTLFGNESSLINNPNNETQLDANSHERMNSRLSPLEEVELRSRLKTLILNKNHLNTLIYLIENLIKYGAAFAVTEEEATWCVQEGDGVRVHKRIMAKKPAECEESKEILQETIYILGELNEAMKSYLPLLLGLLNTKEAIMKENKPTYLVLKAMCLIACDIPWVEEEDDEDDEFVDTFADEFDRLEEELKGLGMHLDHMRGKFDVSEDDDSDEFYECLCTKQCDVCGGGLDDEDGEDDSFKKFCRNVERVKGGRNLANVEGDKKMKDRKGAKSIAHVKGNKKMKDNKGAKSIAHIKGNKKMKDNKAAKSIARVESNKKIKGNKAGKSIARVEGGKNIKNGKGVKNFEVIKNIEVTEDIEVIEDVEVIKIIKNIEVVEDIQVIEDDEYDEYDEDTYDFDSDTSGDEDMYVLAKDPEVIEMDSDTDEEFYANAVPFSDTAVPGDKYSFFFSAEECSAYLAMSWRRILANPEVDAESSWRELYEFESALASTSKGRNATTKTGRKTKRSKNGSSDRLIAENLKRRAIMMKVTKGLIKQLNSDMNTVGSMDQSS